MADTLLHKFHSAKVDFVDDTLVRPSDWNDNHIFSGGTDGQLLARKAAADGGFEWVDPVTFDYVDVRTYATGGTGSHGSPWTGWETAFSSTVFKNFYFRAGFYQTSTALVLTESHPDSSDLCGYFSIKGAGPDKSVILWEPTGAVANGSIPELGIVSLKTWLTIGAVGKQCIGVEVSNLGIASADSTYQKRAMHFIDFRFCKVNFIMMNTPGTHWHDSSASSIALHIEGRGQNTVDHCYLASCDYPLIIGGSPNEPGLNEYDTSIFSNISCAVTRGGTDKGPAWVAHPNIYVQHECLLHRTLFQMINFNGGSYGFLYAGEMNGTHEGNTFDTISWEDPCPLNPGDIAVARVTANISPSTMVVGDPYLDNVDLEPASAWGYFFSINMSNGAQGMYNLTLRNIMQNEGANGLSLHRIYNVLIENYRAEGLGHLGLSYPGQLVQNDTTDPLLDANKAVYLDISGVRVGGPTYTSFPVTAINCQAHGSGIFFLSDDIDCVYQLYPDPIAYSGTNTENINPFNLFKSPVTVWDAVRDVVTGYAFAGIYEFTPRLLSTGGSGEPTYFIQRGVMAVQNVSGMQMISFNLTLSIDTIPGTMSGDAYIEPAAPIWGNRGGATGDTKPGGAQVFVPIAVGPFSGITFTAGHTQLTARMAADSQRIFLEEVGSATSHVVIPISAVADGTLLTLSGTFFVGI